MSAFVAISSLALTLGLLLVPGGALLAPFALALFLLALTGVLGERGDRTVRQHEPATNPRGWRETQ
jgi:hypothetical protein